MEAGAGKTCDVMGTSNSFTTLLVPFISVRVVDEAFMLVSLGCAYQTAQTVPQLLFVYTLL